MGQNNDTREHGDRQGQQGGQMDKKNGHEQVQKRAIPEENVAGSDNKDKSANQSGDHNKT